MQDLTLNIYKPRNIPVYRTFSPEYGHGNDSVKFLIAELQKLPEDATYTIDTDSYAVCTKHYRLETPEEVQARRAKDKRSDEFFIQQEKKQLIALAKKYSDIVKILED
jgi:hypothetical protein